MKTNQVNKRSMYALILLLAQGNLSNAFSPPLPHHLNKNQLQKNNKQYIKGPRIVASDVLEYKRTLLSMLDLDSAEGFAEGEALAKELYENVKVREFRKKLKAQEEQEKKGKDTIVKAKTKSKKESKEIENASEKSKEKRAMNREFLSNKREVKLEQDEDVPKEQFSPFPTKEKKGEESKSTFFTLGTVFDIPSSSSRGGQTSALAIPQASDNLDSSRGSVLAQLGFVVGFLAFYLFVGINGGTLKVAEEAVAGINSNVIETVLDQGLDTSTMLGLDAANMFDPIL